MHNALAPCIFIYLPRSRRPEVVASVQVTFMPHPSHLLKKNFPPCLFIARFSRMIKKNISFNNSNLPSRKIRPVILEGKENNLDRDIGRDRNLLDADGDGYENEGLCYHSFSLSF
jgi:hypothetical protein